MRQSVNEALGWSVTWEAEKTSFFQANGTPGRSRTIPASASGLTEASSFQSSRT